jgi:hypothetical protein
VRFGPAVRINRRWALLAASFVLLASCVTAGDTGGGGTDKAQVRAEIMPLFEAMQAAANVHDAEAHLAYFIRSPDLTFVVNGRQIRGRDNLLDQQKRWWPGGRIPPTDQASPPYRLLEGPAFEPFGPRLAMVTFVLDARRLYPDRVTRRPLAVSQLWQKRPEGWRIVYAHESAGPERPEG